jgi:activator of HSP90 ATPase
LITRPAAAATPNQDGISRAAAAIHQEPLIAANRVRIYRTLTDAGQFEMLTRLSAAAQSMGLEHKPARIDAQPGGAFELFGGYVTGRFLELMPGERIVQAWRAASWPPGRYSIARFQLVEQGTGTRIDFDHEGFPDGQAEHLAEGWQINYWQPLAKLLG